MINPPSTLKEAQAALQREQRRLQEARQGRDEVHNMWGKTRALARAAERLLEENHLSERIQQSLGGIP